MTALAAALIGPTPNALGAEEKSEARTLTVLERRSPEWLKNAVVYQIYPQSFCDADGDGIGDLQGIISKLDYIKSLGVTAIWLNPIYESPFGDAGYDVSNYLKVAPRYGTNDDVKRLFAEAHKRGIRVLLDLVAGHCSVEHPWFKDACSSASAEHADWFIWNDNPPLDRPKGGPKWVKSPGARPGGYLPNFFDFQPALNYGYGRRPDPARPWERPIDDPASLKVREAMREVMRFWLDLGCDGFRVDMAASLVRGGGVEKLWQDYRQWLNKNYPEAVLVSEWSRPRSAIRAGFDVDFLIHFENPAYTHLVLPDIRGKRPNKTFFSRNGSGDIAAFVAAYLPDYEASRHLGFIAIPTGNHDFVRARSYERDIDDLKVFHAMLLTMPGVPFIYYGDEIGMRSIPNIPSKEGAEWRTACRTPMQWAPGEKAGFSTAEPGNFYLPLDPDPKRPNVEHEEKDPVSLLNHLRRLIRLRRDEPSLGNLGGFQVLYAEKNTYPFVYLRYGGNADVVVAINPAERPVDWSDPRMTGAKAIMSQRANLDGSTVHLGPVSYGIFVLQRGH